MVFKKKLIKSNNFLEGYFDEVMILWDSRLQIKWGFWSYENQNYKFENLPNSLQEFGA